MTFSFFCNIFRLSDLCLCCLDPTMVGCGTLMSSYRVQMPLLARRCGRRANERLSLPPQEGATIFQSRASLPHTLLFSLRPFRWNKALTLLLLLPAPCFQVVAPIPGPHPPPRAPNPRDSLTQFERAWVRNVAAVRTQLGQTGGGKWAAMRRSHLL